MEGEVDGDSESSVDHPVEIALMRARIDRAISHRSAFGEAWAAHLERRPRRTKIEIDESGHGVVRIVESEPIPVELSLLLGEFLYELRAALDNCLYAVAVIESQQRPPPSAERLEWPICLSERSWAEHVRRRLTTLSPAVQRALANIQPFMAEWPEWNCLWILHDLARIDRHRTAHLTAPFLANAKAAVDTEHIADLDVQLGIVPEDGIVATFSKLTPGPVRPQDLDLDFTFDVEIAEVTYSPHPETGRPQRPWGALDERTKALVRAVTEYTEGLVAIARQQPDAPDPYFTQG
jgi:hypothetical protein